MGVEERFIPAILEFLTANIPANKEGQEGLYIALRAHKAGRNKSQARKVEVPGMASSWELPMNTEDLATEIFNTLYAAEFPPETHYWIFLYETGESNPRVTSLPLRPPVSHKMDDIESEIKGSDISLKYFLKFNQKQNEQSERNNLEYLGMAQKFYTAGMETVPKMMGIMGQLLEKVVDSKLEEAKAKAELLQNQGSELPIEEFLKMAGPALEKFFSGGQSAQPTPSDIPFSDLKPKEAVISHLNAVHKLLEENPAVMLDDDIMTTAGPVFQMVMIYRKSHGK